MEPQKYVSETNFHFLINLAQCFLLIPLYTVTECTKKFKWVSCKTIATVILTILSFVEVVLFLNYLLQQEKKFPLTSGFAFYLSIFIYKVLFINIARKWPALMKKWCEIDFIMQNYEIMEDCKCKIKLISFVCFALALGEHIFFTMSLEIFLLRLPLLEELQQYFCTIFKFVFMVTPYNIYLAVFAQILNWLWTIIWNYVDVFLISLFISFTFRLKQIEQRIATMVKHKVQEVSQWKEIREHFAKLNELCREIENTVSYLVLISFANKFYTVLYQLLGLLSGDHYGIEQNTKVINRFYYAISFVFILLRIAAVIYFASVIELKNRDIACNLFAVSSDAYNTEIERFITNIRVAPPIISGAKLFELKKSLLLKIFSSVIIYELVIIKFHQMK